MRTCHGCKSNAVTGTHTHGGDLVTVHYGGGVTGSTSVAAAAERLGITDSTYRRVLAELVASGYLTHRGDGAYDAEGWLA